MGPMWAQQAQPRFFYDRHFFRPLHLPVQRQSPELRLLWQYYGYIVFLGNVNDIQWYHGLVSQKN